MAGPGWAGLGAVRGLLEMSCKISQDLGSFNRQDYVRKILCFSHDSCQILVRYDKYT